MEDRGKAVDTFKINIEAVLDDKALNEIADKLYDKLLNRFINYDDYTVNINTVKLIDVNKLSEEVSKMLVKSLRNSIQ
jgi:hypothetical protein